MGRLRPGLKKALPSFLIGLGAALLVRFIAESQLKKRESSEGSARVPGETTYKSEHNGHQSRDPGHLISFFEGPL